MSSKKKTTATKEDGKPALLPKLRFPEFRGDEGWRIATLDSVCEILNNRRRPITGNERTPGPYPYYGASGIVDYVGDFIFDERLLLVGEDGAKWGAFEKTAFIAEGKYWVNNHAHVLKPFAANDTLLESYLTMQDLSPFVTGAAPPKLTLGKLKGIPVPLPPKPAEQQKIAECLSSVDELMAAQSRKVDALKTHKKGLMQQLFPREGETQPRLRFPEFQDAGEWEMKRLDELVDIQSGATPSKANPAFWNGSVPWVSAKDMKRLFLDDAEDHISVAAVEDGARLVPPGTLLMLTRGMTLLKDVPICVLRCEMSFNQDVKGLRPKDGVEGLFLAWMLLGNKPRLLAMVNIAGHGTGKLDTEELKALELMLPPPPEQQRIADCLTSLDDLIAAQTQKLDALKTHKKGLMQQLFPSPEEIES